MSAEIWFKRDRLEIHVIACLCAGVAVKYPYRHEAAMAWGRILKDAVTDGKLEAQLNGDEPNNQSTVDRKALREFATLKKDPELLRFCDKWDTGHNRSPQSFSVSTYPEETRCRVWLEGLVEKVEKQGEGAPVPTKPDVCIQAMNKFEVSRRGFENRIWPAVVPDSWRRRGPKTTHRKSK